MTTNNNEKRTMLISLKIDNNIEQIIKELKQNYSLEDDEIIQTFNSCLYRVNHELKIKASKQK